MLPALGGDPLGACEGVTGRGVPPAEGPRNGVSGGLLPGSSRPAREGTLGPRPGGRPGCSVQTSGQSASRAAAQLRGPPSTSDGAGTTAGAGGWGARGVVLQRGPQAAGVTRGRGGVGSGRAAARPGSEVRRVAGAPCVEEEEAEWPERSLPDLQSGSERNRLKEVSGRLCPDRGNRHLAGSWPPTGRREPWAHASSPAPRQRA